MSYQQIKWMILLLPTLTIGVWEYVRHTMLLPYISMELGNYLSPFIVFCVSVVFLSRLFSLLETVQGELNEEKTKKAALEEREKVARELHDGIAQSLFLLSVKMSKLEKQASLTSHPQFQKIKKTLQHVHDDTRHAINSLRSHPVSSAVAWTDTIRGYLEELKQDYQLEVHMVWEIDESKMNAKEKIELYSCVKEAVLNAVKHGKTNELWIQALPEGEGWSCVVKNKCSPFTLAESGKGFGLQITQDRAKAMDWTFYTLKEYEMFIAVLRKGGISHEYSYSHSGS
ncbi:sensor histidine kinase [Fictibacillus sp. NRS-1165]|uniref:sensor histidine kinase n=1 Tax=Fictibacillus sp. NRS-1165 TaxID=3144463 RepID=UPI003D1D9AEB